MRLPLNSPPPISNGFGVPDSNAAFSRHAGIDWPVGTGTPIFASVSGDISIVRNDKYHGNVVDIHNGDKWYRVMHLSSFVRTSGHVDEGQEIAKSGNSGLSTGPHVHFDVRTEYNPSSFNKFVDPLTLIKEEDMAEKIGDTPQEFSRWSKLHAQIRGRAPSSKQDFINAALNRPWLQAMEILSDDPEANDNVENANVGRVARRDNWEKQISDGLVAIDGLKKQLDKANVEISPKLQAQLDKISADTAETKGLVQWVQSLLTKIFK